MITIEYNIKDMKVLGENDTVKTVIIDVKFVKDTGCIFQYETIVKLDEPAESFINFEDLTKDLVISWCESKIFSGPESKEMVLQRMEQYFIENESSKLPSAW